ncbi:hypothetical protein, partial [Leptospira interrogans]|uniref:hypothetical protein n=1 Tax=Leptospira interrogans TaxID=173 RepID=UPI001F055C8E
LWNFSTTLMNYKSIQDKILKILSTDLGIRSLRLYESYISIFRKTSNYAYLLQSDCILLF